MRERPTNFTLNPASPLYRGLVFAALGQHPGAKLYHDASPVKNNGTLTNYSGAGDLPVDRWKWNQTLRRNVLSFDGSDDYVSITRLDISVPFTLSAWMMVNAGSAATQSLYAKYTYGGNANPVIFSCLSGPVAFYFSGASVSSGFGDSRDGLWHHWLFGWTGTTLLMYRDGIANATSGSFSGTPDISWNTTFIGRAESGYYHNGEIADLFITLQPPSLHLARALADPSNVDLRIGSTPLIQSIRRFWPVGPVSGEAPPAADNRRRRVLTAA